MRVIIASRIFDPEPSAATFRLRALAEAFTAAGHEVTVLTVRPPKRLAEDAKDSARSYDVRRAPVLRDRADYVRGYLPYISFDVPLFFRLLFGRNADLIVVEPPPTTGFFVRLAAALRRTPYAYYAADIWSDASKQTGAPRWVVRVVRNIELFALRGASAVLSVSREVTRRLAELGLDRDVVTVGNGVDAGAFAAGIAALPELDPSEQRIFVYAGTASEWHGVQVFVDAMPRVLQHYPDARLRFIGGGSETGMLRKRAEELGLEGSVMFEPSLSPAELAPVLRDSVAALASVRAGSGYDFAFPTKLYSAAVCGAPLIYAGIGPAVDFVQSIVDGLPLGVAVPAEPIAVADAMLDQLRNPVTRLRRELVASWASEHVSLDSVAAVAVTHLAGTPEL